MHSSSPPGVLDRVFKPRSVAVVGASADPRKLGHTVLRSLIAGGFPGLIFPVNAKRSEILDLQTFGSLLEVPSRVDLVVSIVPAEATPKVMAQAAEVAAGGALVLSSGFKEAGRPDLERQMQEIARTSGLRILGPNIQGMSYLPSRLNAVFWPVLKTVGSIGVVGQSGTVSAALADWAEGEGLGLSAMVNLGNRVDICEQEVMAFLARDGYTKAMALYLESIVGGRDFFEEMRRLVVDMPVAVLKTGRSVAGRRAAASHTGALGGQDRIFSAACRQYGLVRVDDVTALWDVTKAMALLKKPAGRRLLTLTTSGGLSGLVADAAEAAGLLQPELSAGMRPESWTPAFSGRSTVANPVDLATVDTGPFMDMLGRAQANERMDLFLLGVGDPIPGLVDALRELPPWFTGRLAVVLMGGGPEEREQARQLHAIGIPVFPAPERAIRAIAAVAWTAEWARELS